MTWLYFTHFIFPVLCWSSPPCGSPTTKPRRVMTLLFTTTTSVLEVGDHNLSMKKLCTHALNRTDQVVKGPWTDAGVRILEGDSTEEPRKIPKKNKKAKKVLYARILSVLCTQSGQWLSVLLKRTKFYFVMVRLRWNYGYWTIKLYIIIESYIISLSLIYFFSLTKYWGLIQQYSLHIDQLKYSKCVWPLDCIYNNKLTDIEQIKKLSANH